ncbi:MAG: hypothetical protein ACJ8BC_17045, partial [Gemmatimonadales bacterium]
YGVALLFATGSAAHVQALADQRGLRLDRRGLHREDELIPCASEADVYAAFGLPFIEPELREGHGKLDLALAQRLPALVTDRDIQGLLHCHTDFSDGANTLAEMAEATRARGYTYFGVADHSRSAHYAGGLSIEEVHAQHALVPRIQHPLSRCRGVSPVTRPRDLGGPVQATVGVAQGTLRRSSPGALTRPLRAWRKACLAIKARAGDPPASAG